MAAEFDIAGTTLQSGLSVIEASAGTGKTYTITRLVPRLLLDGTAQELSQILLVTYTTDAAGELADRVRHVLEALQSPPPDDEQHRDPGLHAIRSRFPQPAIAETVGRALRDIDRLNVSTIHSFCQRILQDESVFCGVPVLPELLTDRGELIREVLHDVWEDAVPTDPTLAALAAAGTLSLDDDTKLAQLASTLEDFEPRPPAEDLDAILHALDACRGAFSKAVREELHAFLKDVPDPAWNKDSQSAKLRNDHLAALGPDAPLEQWIPAVEWIHGLTLGKGGAIKATSKANKELIAKASALPFSQAAGTSIRTLNAIPRAWQIHALRSVITTTKERLAAGRQLTYDGLIRSVRDALLRGPQRRQLLSRLRHRFRIALVDESQDTDPDQFAIFRTVFLDTDGDEAARDHRLVLVGDPKQAIYAFRGADLNTYLAARDQATASNLSTLNRTFRAPEALVRAVNALFRAPNAFRNPGIVFEPARSGLQGSDAFLDDGPDAVRRRVEVWIAPDDEAQGYSSNAKRLPRISGEVASEIARLLNSNATLAGDGERAVQPGDFAVLVSRHTEADAVKEALSARGIPCVAAGGADVMSTDEADELFRILSALDNPRRQDLRFAALSTRMLGRNDADLAEMARDGDGMLAGFTAWQATLMRHGVAAALVEIDRDTGLGTRLAGADDGERRLTNFRQLTDILQAAFLTHGCRPNRLLRWFGTEITRAKQDDRAAVEERQQQLERDTKAVRIVTMHSAKGLEFPLVFCPFLGAPVESARQAWKILSDPSAPHPLLVHAPSADDETLAALQAAEFEDRLRLAYVAMTRARAKLWIYAGAASGSKEPSVLDWLFRGTEPDLPAEITLRGARHADGLDRLAGEGGAADVICIRTPPRATDIPWTGEARAADSAALAALPEPALPAVWTMTSFSELTREKNPKGEEAAAGDHPEEPPDPAAGNAFLDAPGGASIGTAVHDWIEGWDFSPPEAASVRAHFGRYTLPLMSEGAPLHERLTSVFSELRSSRLPLFDCSIAAACPDPAASEWHFQLPIETGISPRRLAEIFSRHGEDRYAPMLEALEQDEVPGYLHGFIDRIAFHDGQWGVIDWKTNRLGPSAASHSDHATLLECAMRSHYLLQMHLYIVALRRFLGQTRGTLPAWLVFLRGVRADTAEGILEIRPPEALINELDGLFRRHSP